MAALTVEQQIGQLNDARKLVLQDANLYPPIIQGILPIIGPTALVEFKRWGAEFLAETFASPHVPVVQKEALSLVVLETLKLMIENALEDSSVIKCVVQTAASIYPLVVRWIINNGYDGPTWERMLAIKSRILRIWDSAATGVRICCIKFAQRVVYVQTVGPAADSQQSSPLEVSLAMVPPNHALLTPRNMEAEASGLLDRMLSVFQENSSDALLVDATLNSLSALIRARPQLANKILNVVLNFNPLKQANSPMTPKLRVIVKSMEKTTRMLLIHVNKRDPHNPLAGRIHQYIERMMRSKTEIFDESSRKRGAPEPTDGLDAAKRQKLGAQVKPAPTQTQLEVPPLSPGSHTIAELFTITPDQALRAFDVAMLSEDLVVKIGITILQRINADTLDQAVAGIRKRYQSLIVAPKPPEIEAINPGTAPLGVDDDEDDYEPNFYNAEDSEQILNKLDNAPPEEPEIVKAAPEVAVGPFTLSQPPPLTLEEATEIGQGTVSRVFGVMQTLEEPGKKTKSGMNRLAASAYDRDAWITIITRLATRASAGIEDLNSVKVEASASRSLNDTIRETIYLYVLEDFRKRIDVAVAWLCEEWYNDKIQMKYGENASLHYDKWVIKVLDGIVPYLDARDKVLTRFLSEIPGLSADVLARVKGLCRDPSMVNLALTSLLYLVMMRPPVREIALDAVEDVWSSYEDAKPMAAKYLTKWRPGFAERIKEPEAGENKENGLAVAAAT